MKFANHQDWRSELKCVFVMVCLRDNNKATALNLKQAVETLPNATLHVCNTLFFFLGIIEETIYTLVFGPLFLRFIWHQNWSTSNRRTQQHWAPNQLLQACPRYHFLKNKRVDHHWLMTKHSRLHCRTVTVLILRAPSTFYIKLQASRTNKTDGPGLAQTISPIPGLLSSALSIDTTRQCKEKPALYEISVVPKYTLRQIAVRRKFKISKTKTDHKFVNKPILFFILIFIYCKRINNVFHYFAINSGQAKASIPTLQYNYYYTFISHKYKY